MMGFGGAGTPPNPPFGSNNNNTGFGAPPAAFGGTTPAPTGFGAPQQQQQGGFGATGFGAASPPAANTFNGGGFGANTPPQVSTGFGGAPHATAAAPAGMSFGSSANIATFGQSSNTAPTSSGGGGGGFGQPAYGAAPAPSGFGAPASSGFGSSPSATSFAPSSQPFGNPSQGMAPFGSSNITAQQTSTGFGSSNTSVGFGASPPAAAAPFGSSLPQQTGYGNQVGSPAAFGNSNATNAAPNNPFGAASSAPTAAVTFGVSSNVGGGFGASDAAMMGGGSSPTPNDRFGSPMHPHSDNDDMDDHHLSHLPFGTTAAPTGAWPAAAASSFGGSQGLGSIPESGPAGGMNTVRSAASDDTIKAVSAEEAKLAQLKARIEEKKKRVGEKMKRVEEQKRKKAEAAARKTELSAAAPAYVPSPAPAFIGGPPPPPPSLARSSTSSQPGQSLADKNALRFSSTKNDASIRSHLPADLRAMAESTSTTDYASLRVEEREDPQNLENAVSLQGVCAHMCPDEELLRRERESDIQLLEIPQPGRLHPESWTLRNTVVKRFRRSAADYKLDVPEWVRPPDVLESAVAYLEEWVMERDRQGPDPRFPQGVVPPPLDVYQFIWDRTRMIRKDFILQNYIGTSGNCDARAVRCHERIARWHAMCEHQLSHLSQFVIAQSQQNIQELGQTMKTLNQYYDDSLQRCLVEVPDKDGNETRTSSVNCAGCTSDVVQGTNPVDFDGACLVNDTSSPALPLRLINKDTTKTPNHGTAEPEMRGLYILLTMNNDGGMEVLKYAARLFQEQPEVYHSQPVQLAMSIFKAKKEYNYARFFSILRSPSTPYLFACIMFKHVELMRKVAFKIMYKTFGGKRKDGEAIYDAYQLKDLVRLLCFEDADEAQAACKHYNIVVKMNHPVKNSRGEPSVEDMVFWKHGAFRERKDPDKGTIIPLRPRKMMKTIESKLKGATRLAVCRGEVSGEGSFLTNIPPRRGAALSTPQAMADNAALLEQRTAAMRAMKQRQEERQALDAQKNKEAEAVRRREEQLKVKELQRKQLVELEKLQQIEAEEKKTLELQRQREIAEAEKTRIAQEKREREEKRLEMEREATRKKAEEEQKRKLELKRQESARREQERKLHEEQERKLREEQEKRQREERARQLQMEEEARRVRQAAEAKRLEELKRRQAEEKRRRDAAARRDELEWRDRINTARKRVLWLRVLQSFPRDLQMIEQTEESLRRLDSTSASGLLLDSFANGSVHASNLASANQMMQERPTDVRRVVERLLHQAPERLELAPLLASQSSTQDWADVATRHAGCPTAMLFKIAVVLPDSTDSRSQSLCDLIHTWVSSRLNYGQIKVDKADRAETRVVVVDGNDSHNLHTCDAVLFVVGPPWSDTENRLSPDSESLTSLAARIDKDVARTVLVLGESSDPDSAKTQSVAQAFLGSFKTIRVAMNADLSDEAMESALASSCESVVELLADREPLGLERVSVGQLALQCISTVLWQDRLLEQRDDILVHARAALHCLVDEFESLQSNENSQTDWQWPASDFAENGSAVPNYFGKGEDLPMNWIASLSRAELGPAVALVVNALSGPLPSVIQNLLVGAPYFVKQHVESLLDQRLFRRCLEEALTWSFQDSPTRTRPTSYIYLPRGVLEDMVHGTIERLQGELTGLLEPTEVIAPATETEESSLALIPTRRNSPLRSLPTQSLRKDSDVQATNKRPWSDSAFEADPSPELIRTHTPPKRQRRHTDSSVSPPLSRDQQESAAFTRRLDSLLAGSVVPDMIVGTETLSALLRGAPALRGPKNY